MKVGLYKLIGMTIAMSIPLAQATSSEKQSTSLDAHVHGLSEMTIVIEGQMLEIQLKSPAMNIIGFEHKANTERDINSVKNAALLLGKHDSLFLLSGGACKLSNKTTDVSGIIDNDHKHENKSNEHKDHQENHRDITAGYRYNCEDIGKLSSITIGIFEKFSGIHKINAMWVTEKRQGAEMLSEKNNTVSLR